jgi:hypothetical protein
LVFERKERRMARRNMVAWVALVLALGGTSYAAVGVPAGSVGTKQLRNGAVTNAKVRRHTLTAGALTPGTLAVHAVVRHRDFPFPIVCPGMPPTGGGPCFALVSFTETTKCPSGTTATGGGYSIPPAYQGLLVAAESAPSGDDGWTVTLTTSNPHGQTSDVGESEGTTYVVCESPR